MKDQDNHFDNNKVSNDFLELLSRRSSYLVVTLHCSTENAAAAAAAVYRDSFEISSTYGNNIISYQLVMDKKR